MLPKMFFSLACSSLFALFLLVGSVDALPAFAGAGALPANVVHFTSGMSFPRGLKFGPDGYLYVAESGPGGDISTVGQCPQVPNVGPWTGGYNGRISRINSSGVRTTVADGFPSTFSPVGGELGVADIAFLDGHLFALISGGGCSHGHINPADDNAVVRIDSDGSRTMVADISVFVKNNETAKPEPDDFEPDGTPYSMVTAKGSLFVVEPNHGQVLQINAGGKGSRGASVTEPISRLVDVSAVFGHIVPTAMTYHGNLYIGNLGTFPIHVGSSQIMKVTPSGQISTVATGLTAVLGVAFDKESNLYALEMSTVDGENPVPGSGRVVRVLGDGTLQPVVTGLMLPTAMTFGPDGKLYISNWGFGPPFGEILQVTL